MRRRAAAAVVSALAVAAGCWLLQVRARETLTEPPPTLPQLDVRCSAPAAARVGHGRDAALAAAAAIERYPFDPAAGRSALQLLLEAERCFDLGGERSAGLEAAARAHALRTRLQGDCRDHFLRYRVARASERLEHALDDVEFLLALCAPEHGALAPRLQRARLEISERTHSQEAP